MMCSCGTLRRVLSRLTRASCSAAMIPTSIILGDKEKGVATCKRLPRRKRLSVIIFPGIYHGFDQPTATPLKKGRLRKDIAGNKRLYSKSATQKAQSQVKEFLVAKLAVGSVPAGVDKTDAPKLGKVGGKDPYMAVSKRDTDGDGKISVAEWNKSPKLFSKIDGDGDGFLTPQEFHDRWQSRQ